MPHNWYIIVLSKLFTNSAIPRYTKTSEIHTLLSCMFRFDAMAVAIKHTKAQTTHTSANSCDAGSLIANQSKHTAKAIPPQIESLIKLLFFLIFFPPLVMIIMSKPFDDGLRKTKYYLHYYNTINIKCQENTVFLVVTKLQFRLVIFSKNF